jgi:hypothetical protein
MRWLHVDLSWMTLSKGPQKLGTWRNFDQAAVQIVKTNFQAAPARFGALDDLDIVKNSKKLEELSIMV